MAEGQQPETTYPVQLYVYDLSNGLARSLSRQLTGRQFDAIYHTSIVVHGREYYFGQGIFTSPTPGRTHFGTPIERVDLGSTAVDNATLEEILTDLRQRYTAQAYHLLSFNCNTFSNELANIIVGRDIPAHITSLPQDFLATPFGQMMGPQIDAMFRGAVNGGSGVQPGAAPSNGFSPSAMGILNNVAHTAMGGGHGQTPLNNQQSVASSSSSSLSSANVRDIQSIAQLDDLKRTSPASVVMYTSQSCGPCVQLHPVYKSLADRYADRSSPKYRPIVFGLVESSQRSSLLMMQEKVTATPTFQFYQGAKKVSELRGANPSSLEDEIEALLWRLHRPHPHSKLRTSPLSSVPSQPFRYKTIPNLTVAVQKLNDITSKHKAASFGEKADLQDGRSALTKTLVPWIENGLARGRQIRMPEIDILRWVKGAQRCIEVLECKDVFPIVDLVRMALLDEEQCKALAQSENTRLLDEIYTKARKDMDVGQNKATLLTTFRLLGNALTSEAVGHHAANNEDVTALLVFGILCDDVSVRTATINAAFNWTRFHSKGRSTFLKAPLQAGDSTEEEDGVNVDVEVEVLCALIECLETETDIERLHRLAATIVMLLYCVPAWQSTVQPLLEVIDASQKLQTKAESLAAEDSDKTREVKTLLESARKLCVES